MPEILLVTINAKWIHPSLALRLLKANLGNHEENCEILEFALRQPLAEKTEPVLARQPRLLGLSVSIWNHLATLELLEELETKWAGERPLVVLGGPEVSWLPEDAEIFRHADYVIRGEGEESFRLLCDKVFDPGFPRPAGKNTVFINRGETPADVESIASAYHLYTDEDLQKKLCYVEASRGCPFGCEFCQGGTKKVREFPLESFLASMGTLIDRGGRNFKFLDRTFNLDIARAQKIMEFFLDRIIARITARITAPGKGDGIENRPLCVHFEMVPGRFPPELKELISRFPPGTLRLEVGIQTLNTMTAALIHRPDISPNNKIENELDNIKFLCAETNAILHVDLIAGLPGEDMASFGRGFDRLWQIMSGTGRNFEIQLGILKCLPGTPIIRRIEAYRMRYSPTPPYEVIETGVLSGTDLGKIKNFARFWESIVNRHSFPDLTPRLLPPGEPCFGAFMELSDKLLENFGRNWGIERTALGTYLSSYLAMQKSRT